MGFEELIKEFGLTVDTYEDLMDGGMSFVFRSKDRQYGYGRTISRDDLMDRDLCEIQQAITDEVRLIFKTRDYEQKQKAAEAFLITILDGIKQHVPAYKINMVRDAFIKEDPDDIYMLMPTKQGRLQAIAAFHKYLEGLQRIRKEG